MGAGPAMGQGVGKTLRAGRELANAITNGLQDVDDEVLDEGDEHDYYFDDEGDEQQVEQMQMLMGGPGA